MSNLRGARAYAGPRLPPPLSPSCPICLGLYLDRSSLAHHVWSREGWWFGASIWDWEEVLVHKSSKWGILMQNLKISMHDWNFSFEILTKILLARNKLSTRRGAVFIDKWECKKKKKWAENKVGKMVNNENKLWDWFFLNKKFMGHLKIVETILYFSLWCTFSHWVSTVHIDMDMSLILHVLFNVNLWSLQLQLLECREGKKWFKASKQCSFVIKEIKHPNAK